MLDIVPDYIVRALSDPHDHINDKPSKHQKSLARVESYSEKVMIQSCYTRRIYSTSQ